MCCVFLSLVLGLLGIRDVTTLSKQFFPTIPLLRANRSLYFGGGDVVPKIRLLALCLVACLPASLCLLSFPAIYWLILYLYYLLVGSLRRSACRCISVWGSISYIEFVRYIGNFLSHIGVFVLTNTSTKIWG